MEKSGGVVEGEGEKFIKDESKVASRVSGNLVKLLSESNE